MAHPEHDPASAQRETFLVVFLCLLVLGGGMVFAMVLMGMFVLHALGVMAVVVCFGGLHYLVWGRSLSRQVALEQEEQEGFRALEEPEPPDDSIQARKY